MPPCDDELAMSGRRAAAELADVLAASSVDETGVVVNPFVIRGPAAAALLEASRSAVLLVVGRHAGHGIASLGLGSVARQVPADAVCPVIVTPPSRRQGRRPPARNARVPAAP